MKKTILALFVLLLSAATASAGNFDCASANSVTLKQTSKVADVTLKELNKALDIQRNGYKDLMKSEFGRLMFGRAMKKATKSNINTLRYMLVTNCGSVGHAAPQKTLDEIYQLIDKGIILH